MSVLRWSSLIAASLLTLVSVLDVVVHLWTGAQLLLSSLAAMIRCAAAVCWIGYLVAWARDNILELTVGNRDLVMADVRRLDQAVRELSDELRSTGANVSTMRSTTATRAHLSPVGHSNRIESN